MTTWKNRIAVVSRDPDFCTFFELEAIACGCPVFVLRAVPTELSQYDVVIVDAQTGYCVSEGQTCAVITVIRAEAQRKDWLSPTTWEWPVSVETVRALYEARRSDVVREAARPEDLTPTLYLLSEEERRVLYRNREITFSEGEWRLLCCLGDARGEPVDRQSLGELFGGSGNIVDVYVHALRKKLEQPFGIRIIETVRGRGYRLRAVMKQKEA